MDWEEWWREGGRDGEGGRVKISWKLIYAKFETRLSVMVGLEIEEVWMHLKSKVVSLSDNDAWEMEVEEKYVGGLKLELGKKIRCFRV